MLILPSPLQFVENALLKSKNIRLFLKRDDLIHDEVTGNKWRKCKYNLQVFEIEKSAYNDTILTFGGAYSNHIRAVAAMGKALGFKTIGIIRGEELAEKPLNDALAFAQNCGMQLHFVSREVYKEKENADYLKTFDDYYLLPEGGSNDWALKGCSEIIDEIELPFDTICCPCGTGGTLSGLILGLKENQKAVGFSVLKGEGYMQKSVSQFLKNHDTDFSYLFEKYTINEKYHFGGYARTTPELLGFIQYFQQEYGVLLDYVYNAKMMYGLFEEIKNTSNFDNQTIVALITGGQSNATSNIASNQLPTYTMD